MKKRRIRRPAASFVLKKGAFARLNNELVRVRGISAKQEVLVQNQATSVMQWVKPGDLRPPAAPESSQVLHPVDADPDAEARARQWVQEFALLPLRPSTTQLEEVALRLGASERTVRRHLCSYRMNPAPAAQLATPPGLASGGTRLPSVLEACIDKAINEELLRRECPPVTVVHERAKSLCRELGLSTVPSYQTVLRRTKRLDPWMVARKRRGSAEGDARQAPALGTVDAPRPLSLIQIDHAIVDVVVVSPVSRLPIGRPWITIAIDVHSRCVLGYYLSMDEPNQTAVGLCLAHACTPKERWLQTLDVDVTYPIFGLMDKISWDNAKTFQATNVKIQCDRRGIEIVPRPVRKPHFGAYIERYIGNFMGAVHLLPGTTFSNPKARGDYDSEARAVMSFRDLERWVALEIAGVYHNKRHRGLKNRTPLQAWQRGWTSENGETRLPPMIADTREFLIGFLPSAARRVQRDGVHFKSLQYWDPNLTGLINDGVDHQFYYNQGDLSKLYLYLNGDYYDIPIHRRQFGPFSEFELREAKKSLADSGQAQNETALLDAIEQKREIVDTAAAVSKAARRKQARRPPGVATPGRASVDYTFPALPMDPASGEIL